MNSEEDPVTQTIDLQTIIQGDSSAKAQRRYTLLGCVAIPFLPVGLAIWLLGRVWLGSWLTMSMMCGIILEATAVLRPDMVEAVSQWVLLAVGGTILFKLWRTYFYWPKAQATVLGWDEATATLIYRYTAPDHTGKKATHIFESDLDPAYVPAWGHSGYTFPVRYAWSHPERHTLGKVFPCRKPFAPRAVEDGVWEISPLTAEIVVEVLRAFARQQCGIDYVADIETESFYHTGSEQVGLHENITWYLSHQPGLALRVTLGERTSDLVIFSAGGPLDKHAPNLGLEPTQQYGFVSTPSALRALLEHLISTGLIAWKV